MFRVRITKPKDSDRFIHFYNNDKNGGISKNCTGNKADGEANVLRNCTGYANGRFNEIIGETLNVEGMYYQLTTDAERFIEQAKGQGLCISDIPSPGAIMCWRKGATLKHADGAGHVEVIERVIDYNEVYTSRSGWTSPVFGNKTRKSGTGNWGQNSDYSFRGFIKNPAVESIVYPIPSFTIIKGTKCIEVRWLQDILNRVGKYNLKIDGSAGAQTIAALTDFQSKHGLNPDSKCGRLTRRKLLEVWQNGN